MRPMRTKGFVPSASDQVTIGTAFNATVNGVANTPCVATYITFVFAGNVVWQNYLGDLQYMVAAANTTYILGATAIVASGTVNGTARTTTVTSATWYGDPINQSGS
jgi:hypothetical protein